MCLTTVCLKIIKTYFLLYNKYHPDYYKRKLLYLYVTWRTFSSNSAFFNAKLNLSGIESRLWMNMGGRKMDGLQKGTIWVKCDLRGKVDGFQSLNTGQFFRMKDSFQRSLPATSWSASGLSTTFET